MSINNNLPTIFQMLTTTANKYPNEKAVVFKDQHISLTWKQLVEQVDHLAAGMYNSGIVKGDRVAIWCRNRVEMLLTQLAAERLGVILVYLIEGLNLVEFEMILNRYSCKALFIQTSHKYPNYFQFLQRLFPNLGDFKSGHLHSTVLPFLRTIVAISHKEYAGTTKFIDILSSGITALSKGLVLGPLELSVSPDDSIAVIFKGSEEERKTGVALSQSIMEKKGIAFAQEKQMTNKDIFCVDVPLYNISGNICSVISCIYSGSKMVFPSEDFDTSKTLKVLTEEKCTILNSTLNGYQNIVDHPKFDPSNVKVNMKLCYQKSLNGSSDSLNLDFLKNKYNLNSLRTSTTSIQPRQIPLNS